MLPLQKVWVQSLVRELRSHMPPQAMGSERPVMLEGPCPRFGAQERPRVGRTAGTLGFISKMLGSHWRAFSKVICQIAVLKKKKKATLGISLMPQWWRICLPMQETWILSLVQEDPTCRRATKPPHHNYVACTLEPRSCNYWSPWAPEPVLSSKRSHCNKKLAHHN